MDNILKCDALKKHLYAVSTIDVTISRYATNRNVKVVILELGED